MSDFLFSFALFWAGTLLLLGYAVILYAVGAGLHYIAEHDEMEAMFTTYAEVDAYRRLMGCTFPLYAALAFGMYVLYVLLFRKPLTGMIDLDITFFFFFVIGLKVCIIDGKPDYPDFSSYFLNKKFGCALLAMAALSCVVYVDEASQWLRKDNAHRKAKLYIVAGQPLYHCKWALTNTIYPEFFAFRPITALQRVMFKRAKELIPDNDAEAAAWENRWFHSHYTRKPRLTMGAHFFGPMRDKDSDSRVLLERWLHCLEEMGNKPFQDERVKNEIYLIDYARLAYVFYYYWEYYYWEIDEKDPLFQKRILFREKVFRQRLYPWLVKLMREWKSASENRARVYKRPEEEASVQVVLARILRDIIHAEIKAGTFRCSNESVQRYLAVLREFHGPANGDKPAYARVGKPAMRDTEDIDAGDILYKQAVWAAGGWPSHAVERYCGEYVPGRRASICGKPDDRYCYWSREKLRSEECAEAVRREDENMQGPEKQILDEIFRGGPGEGPAQPAPPEKPAAKLKTARPNPGGP